ncbi:hypothetical protein PMKS-002583 [Pichia membranifaciens]|uniref:Mitochondrial carrier protein n=1 Tax=Pichia membranifaciens TaxID=4926 RepID=A0A1Q2YIB0_9ASCO|nr:hypothetical protein PMKS-002583 [Pichia membranifaciens]
MDPLPTPNDNTGLSTAMFGGAISGIVQTTLTFPLEYFKTISQIENKSIMLKEAVVPHDSMRPLFTGCLPLSLGMALKSSSRMFIFNQFSNFMADDGKTSAPRVVVAGLMTGVLESFWSIPFENIKVRMIENSMIRYGLRTTLDEEVQKPSKASIDSTTQNAKKPVRLSNRPGSSNSVKEIAKEMINHPRMKALEYYHHNPSYTFSNIVREMYETGGISAFTQGSTITLLRQGMNSMVWYSTYSSFQQLIDPSRDSITELELLAMGFASSMAVVGVTQPIDVIKTRMQTRDYRIVYKDLMTCIALIFFKEGVSKFWSGSVPRFVKVSCSSTVTLLTYEYVTKAVNTLSEIKPFAA